MNRVNEYWTLLHRTNLNEVNACSVVALASVCMSLTHIHLDCVICWYVVPINRLSSQLHNAIEMIMHIICIPIDTSLCVRLLTTIALGQMEKIAVGMTTWKPHTKQPRQVRRTCSARHRKMHNYSQTALIALRHENQYYRFFETDVNSNSHWRSTCLQYYYFYCGFLFIA